MNPRVAIPLPIGSAAANFQEGQVLASGSISRPGRAIAGSPGPMAVGVEDAQPKRLFRRLPGARVCGGVDRGNAPREILVTHAGMNGELETVRVGAHAADGDGDLISTDQR